MGTTRGKRHDIKHIGLHWIHTFRVGDRGQWELLEVRDTTSNTLDSIGYSPLGLIFRGGQWTGDRGQWELLEVSDTTSNTLDSIGCTSLDASIYLSIDTVAMYLRRCPKRAKT